MCDDGKCIAGTEESPGETIIYEGRKFKEYRGMGSLGAMSTGSSDRYFQDVEDDVKKFVPEGIEGRVAYKGTLKEIVYQYTGGLRAGMGYCGAGNIDDLKKATFIKITNAGMKESHPHDVEVTREAPIIADKPCPLKGRLRFILHDLFWNYFIVEMEDMQHGFAIKLRFFSLRRRRWMMRFM